MTPRILTAVVAAILIVALWFAFSLPDDAGPTTPSPPTTPTQTARDDTELRRRRVEMYLADCDRQVEALIPEHLQMVQDYFSGARQRAPRFASEALGFQSKCVLIADWLPGTGKSHRQYLQELFESEVASGDDLENLVRHVLQSMAAEIEGLENDLLVNLEADLQDFSGGPTFTQSAVPSQDLHPVTAQVEQQVLTSLRGDIGRELAAYAAGEVVSIGMGRFGVSAGILGAGAGSSWTNLGVGLLVGMVIDEIVTRIWDWWADPVGQLSAAVEDELKAVEARLVEGEADWPGLRKMLTDQSRRRSDVRRDAILQHLKLQEGH